MFYKLSSWCQYVYRWHTFSMRHIKQLGHTDSSLPNTCLLLLGCVLGLIHSSFPHPVLFCQCLLLTLWFTMCLLPLLAPAPLCELIAHSQLLSPPAHFLLASPPHHQCNINVHHEHGRPFPIPPAPPALSAHHYARVEHECISIHE